MNDRELQDAYTELLAERHTKERTSCASPEELRALVERDGVEADRLRTLDHVMSCTDCNSEFELLRAVGDALPRQRRFLMPGLATAALIAVVGGLMWIGPGRTEHAVYRGADTTSLLIGPAGVLSENPELFEWRAIEEAVSYSIEITAPDGMLVASDSTSETMFVIPAGTELDAGVVYTWRVWAVLPGGIRRDLGTATFEIRR
jgi:hypothetical protein